MITNSVLFSFCVAFQLQKHYLKIVVLPLRGPKNVLNFTGFLTFLQYLTTVLLLNIMFKLVRISKSISILQFIFYLYLKRFILRRKINLIMWINLGVIWYNNSTVAKTKLSVIWVIPIKAFRWWVLPSGSLIDPITVRWPNNFLGEHLGPFSLGLEPRPNFD